MASEVSLHQKWGLSIPCEVLGTDETFYSAERRQFSSASFWLEEGSVEQHSFCLFSECFE